MITFNYNRLLLHYDRSIVFFAKKIGLQDCDDCAQEIRIYIYNHLDRFDPTKSSLNYYINLVILTAYRKVIFDRKKQQIFEDGLGSITNDIPSIETADYYNDIISKIILNLKDEVSVVIFYAILYNKGEKNYSQIANFLNMKYPLFLSYVRKIKEVIREIITEYNLAI